MQFSKKINENILSGKYILHICVLLVWGLFRFNYLHQETKRIRKQIAIILNQTIPERT